MKISDLLSDIGNRDLVLPEFQREYVWSREQAKQLMVSLLKGYPVGGLLFWKTDHPPELKNVNELPEKLGTVQVILDGQQRLTTLYMLMTGKIPAYYVEDDIETDPRELFYNLDTGDLQYYQSSRMKGNPLWRRVVECFSNHEINVFAIAKGQAVDDAQAFELAKRYNDHLTRLRGVKDATLPEQLVPSHATLDEAIDIFDRVNSQGTKLTDAELALTHVTGRWPTARREMKEKIEELNGCHFYFDLTFMTRALTGTVMRRALFETIHGQDKQELEAGWKKLKKILDYLVTLLPQKAFINSTRDLNTSNVLVPLVVYLSLNEGKFPSAKEMSHAIHWLYAAHTWARYTAQTDQRLEHDVSLVVREASPWDFLRAQIVDQRGRIEVKSADLEGRGLQHPLYQMVFILAKAHSAVDWFNGAPLGTPHGNAYYLHNHHIFPQSVLYKSGYEVENHLHRKIVNEIANRAFLTAEANLGIKDKPPEEYLPQVEEKFPGALAKQFIPIDPQLWKVGRYGDFLSARREIMARKLNEFMAGMIVEPQERVERPLTELIGLGEGPHLEFKSTLQWDVIQNQMNTGLRQSVLKTIAGFLNTNGGTLIIGVEDNGAIYGLDNDLKTVGNSTDRFTQLLYSLISDHMGPQYGTLVKTRFEKVEERLLCVVDVERATDPVFLCVPKGKEFHIRVGNTTRGLDSQETVNFIQSNWNQ